MLISNSETKLLHILYVDTNHVKVFSQFVITFYSVN